MKKQKQKWAKIGTVTQNVTKSGQTYINLKFNDDVSVFIDSKEVELSEYRTASLQKVESSKYTIFEIKLEDAKIGEVKKGKEGKNNYIKFEKNVSFKTADGDFVANKDNAATLTDPVQEVERLYKNGVIDEKKYESRLNAAKNASKWLLYTVSLSPAS